MRARRLRRSAGMRELVRETRLDVRQLIWPLFVRPGQGIRDEIASMPGNFHFSVDRLVDEVGLAWDEGIRAVLLFGLPERKDETGSEAWDDGAAVQSAVRALREAYPGLLIATDVCLCAYAMGAEKVLVISSSPINPEKTTDDKKGFFNPGLMVQNFTRLIPYFYNRSQIEDVLSAENMMVVNIAPSYDGDDWPLLTDFRPEVIERMVNEAQSHSEEDKRKRKVAEARNQADSLVYSTEKNLTEHGDKISEEDKTKIQEALAETKKAMEGDDPNAIESAVQNSASIATSPSFSRSGSSTRMIMRPWRRSSMISGMEAMGMSAEGGERRSRARRPSFGRVSPDPP